MKTMVCIICPNSCRLEVTEEDGKTVVRGARCKRGQEFALQEATHPKRTLCTTVRTVFPDYPVMSVKTDKEMEKDLIFRAMNEINQVVVRNRVHIGDVIIKNMLDTGVDVIATADMGKEEAE